MESLSFFRCLDISILGRFYDRRFLWRNFRLAMEILSLPLDLAKKNAQYSKSYNQWVKKVYFHYRLKETKSMI